MINFSEIIQPVEDTVNSFLGNAPSDVHDIQEYCAKAIQSLPNELVDVSSFFAYFARTNILGRLDTTGEYWVEESPGVVWDAAKVCHSICDSDPFLAESILFEYVPTYGGEILPDVIVDQFAKYDPNKYSMGIKRFNSMMAVASLMDISNMVTSVSSFEDLKALLRTYTDGQCLESIFDDVFSISYSSSQSALMSLVQLFNKWILGDGTAAENEEDLLSNYKYAEYVSVSAFAYGFYELAGINLKEGLKQGLIYFFSWSYNLVRTSLQWVFTKLTEVGKSLFSSEIFEVSDHLRDSALPEYPATVTKFSVSQLISYLSGNTGHLTRDHKDAIVRLLSIPRTIKRLIQVGNALVEVDLDSEADSLVIKTYVILSLNNNVAKVGVNVGGYAPSCYITNNGVVGTGLYSNNGALEIVNPAESIVKINNSTLSELGADTDKQILATSIANYINGLYLICARGFAASDVSANYHLLFNDDTSFSISTSSDAWSAYQQLPKTNCYPSSDTMFYPGAIDMDNDQADAVNRILNDRGRATNYDYALAVYGGSFSAIGVSNVTQYNDLFVFACLSTLLGYNGSDTTFFGSKYAWVDDSWVVSSTTCFNSLIYSTYNVLTAEDVKAIYRNRWLVTGAVAVTVLAAYIGFKSGAFKKGFSKLFRKAKVKARVSSGLDGEVEEQLGDSNDKISLILKLIK